MDVLFSPRAGESILSCDLPFYERAFSQCELPSITASTLAARHFSSRFAFGRMH